MCSLKMQMVFLPADDRAFLLDKNGFIYIAEPEKQGFPMKTYMHLPTTYSKEEVGIISILPSNNWAAGDKTFYLYWGHKDSLREGMRISKFAHSENQGGTTSRGKVHTHWCANTVRVLSYLKGEPSETATFPSLPHLPPFPPSSPRWFGWAVPCSSLRKPAHHFIAL